MKPRDNTLAYLDQASFLGLQALGHAPLIQFTWIYLRGADLDGVRTFRRNLAGGMLARRVERSPVPWGRHRWIAWPGPSDVDLSARVRPADQVDQWFEEQAALPIDPEHGPSWRLAVLPLSDGGSAVTLVVSHTVADGVGAAIAVAEAARGIRRDLRYPASDSRTKTQAVLADSKRLVRDLPDIARAVGSVFRVARVGDQVSRASTTPRVRHADTAGSRPVSVPSVTAYADAAHWDERAVQLGGTSNSLAMALAARLGSRLGWVSGDGTTTLSIPVNQRAVGDTRGNALTAVRVTVDPDAVLGDLTHIRSELKQALAGVGDPRSDALAALPLIPLTPKFVARRLERIISGAGIIGCSNVGDLDPAVNKPDGTDADAMAMRMTEQLRRSDLRRSGGVFFPVGVGRVGGQVFISLGYLDADATATRGQLAETLRDVLDELGITGAIGSLHRS